jgi:hypothetical protein
MHRSPSQQGNHVPQNVNIAKVKNNLTYSSNSYGNNSIFVILLIILGEISF